MKKYGLSNVEDAESIAPPELNYQPPMPQQYRPPIALIGAGGISEYHLRAYQRMGLEVVAICDLSQERAAKRAKEFYPDAMVTSDYRQILDDCNAEVLDVATHPEHRSAIIRDAIASGRHVLSQKPFVTDLDEGQELVDLAKRAGVRLAVNQNGRWAPHFSYLHQAIAEGLTGPISSIDYTLQWDHTWTKGTDFEKIHHLVLYDFAIHWFDITTVFMAGRQPQSVYASVRRASYQETAPPFLAHVVIDYDDAQVRMALNAHVSLGQEDRTVVVGEQATLRAFGPELNNQQVRVWTADGVGSPDLHGCWFDSGFEGTMGELLCAIEQDREPQHSAQNVLQSLELCFAALRSADAGRPVEPGSVRVAFRLIAAMLLAQKKRPRRESRRGRNCSKWRKRA